MKKQKQTIDPIRYEMFLHRLWAIGEEGRMTLATSDRLADCLSRRRVHELLL